MSSVARAAAYIEISDDDEPSVPDDVNLDDDDVQADESVRDMADWVDPADGADELNTLQVPMESIAGPKRARSNTQLSVDNASENDAPAPKRVKSLYLFSVPGSPLREAGPSSWASRSSNRVLGQRKLAVASSSVKKGFARPAMPAYKPWF
ncbi:hypothetical protein PLEOSDRAFT_1087447 [Pleurotus ostreatus PC15]|uniref:Uncharacterized protein n=1 Tax=Pleurotus ostreatus (strain PC15) TaxID=1137138 RepID=A0A067N1U4_PLEO1|nr:hypothetical protein PLEOSDRAFT_1087447 [Pleurotus ostreatus PC15]